MAKVNRLKILELFGGIGSPRKALENLRLLIKSIDYVEIWPFAVQAYNLLFDHGHLPQDIKTWNLNVDILIHGSPCQDFSTAGKNDLSSGRSILYQRTLEILENELKPRPKIVIWENVKGLIGKKNYPHFEHYLNQLKRLGYVNKWAVLNAKDFGVAQNRERVFVVSILANEMSHFGHFDFANLKRQIAPPLANFLDAKFDPKYIITQPSMTRSILAQKVKLIDECSLTITTKQMRWNNAGVVRVPLIRSDGTIEEVPMKSSPNFVNFPRASDGQLINGSYNRFWKTDKFVGTISATVKPRIIEVVNDPNYQFPVFIIDGQKYHLRVLTPRECWRLMGWTDADYEKVKYLPETSLYHMAGNAIVVPLLEALFRELLKNFVKFK